MSRTEPRIAHLICPQRIGGAESVVRALARGRAGTGRHTEVIAITADGAGAPLVSALRSAGVTVTTCIPRGRRYLAEAREVADILARHRIDLLHTHVYRADFVGYLAARRAGIPVVSTFHGETGGDRKNRFYEWAVKRLMRRLPAVIAVSETTRERLRAAGVAGAKVHLVPNGAVLESVLDRRAARRELGVGDAVPLVGWIGRLSHEKGPDLFVEALHSLGGAAPRAVVIGDGPERTAMEARARTLGVNVSFTGALPDAARVVRAFDVLVLSSRTEGMPMILLEAVAAQTPVVAFAVGGIPTLLTEVTGWPVPPGDVPALGRVMLTAIREADESRRRAAAAAAIVRRNHGIEQWLAGVDRVYAEVLSKR